jgi:hypothetical protein
VVTQYDHPWERVLWDAQRDCNPFFHLFESLWMLAGRNDVAYLMTFNQKMADFSDDGVIFNGAYGHRWRTHFGFDQLEECITILKREPTTRRCIMTMWDAADLTKKSKDLPCNLAAKFEMRNGCLNLTIFNRSNDVILGAYGANSVHMSFLLEYVACCVGLPMGKYWQISGNYHVYEDTWLSKVRTDLGVDPDLYQAEVHGERPISIHPLGRMMDSSERLGTEIKRFCAQSGGYGDNTFLTTICDPLLGAWGDWKDKNRARALMRVQQIDDQTNDWVNACRMWMERRVMK